MNGRMKGPRISFTEIFHPRSFECEIEMIRSGIHGHAKNLTDNDASTRGNNVSRRRRQPLEPINDK